MKNIRSKIKWLFLIHLGACLFYGCGNSITTEWDGRRRAAGIVGIVNDSLAFQRTYRCWQETDNSFSANGLDDDEGCSHAGLFLINYRRQTSPVWWDTVQDGKHSEYSYTTDQLSDSVVVGTDLSTYVSLWKINQKPIIIKLREKDNGCIKKSYNELKIRKWINNKILIIQDNFQDSSSLSNAKGFCNYAEIDTTSHTIQFKEFNTEQEWMKMCSDITVIENNAVCLEIIYDTNRYGFRIVKNKIAMDSLIIEGGNYSFENSRYAMFLGDYVLMEHPIEYNGATERFEAGRTFHKLDLSTFHIDKIYPNTGFIEYPPAFFEEGKDTIAYGDIELDI